MAEPKKKPETYPLRLETTEHGNLRMMLPRPVTLRVNDTIRYELTAKDGAIEGIAIVERFDGPEAPTKIVHGIETSEEPEA